MSGTLSEAGMLKLAAWVSGQAATPFEAPYHARVIVSAATAATPGTECTGNTYVRKNLGSFPAANLADSESEIVQSEVGGVTWASLDSAAATNTWGFEIWDASNARVGWSHYGFPPVLVGAGQPLAITGGGMPRFAIPTQTIEWDPVVEKRGMDWIVGRTGIIQPTGPFEVRLGSTPPTRTVPTAEFALGGPYARQPITFGAPAIESGVAAVRNTAQVNFDGIEAAATRTVRGVEVYDSTGQRCWYDTVNVSVPAGLGLHIPVGGHAVKVG